MIQLPGDGDVSSPGMTCYAMLSARKFKRASLRDWG
jgi:hypothetical protein